MPYSDIKPGKVPFTLFIYRFLLVCFVCLALAVLGGTVYSYLRDRSPVIQPGPAPAALFTGIGRLRLPAAGGATVILSVTFPYDQKDRAFAEELAARVQGFRTQAGEYFALMDAAEIREKNEEILKAELLTRFNGILRLGKIGILYFGDFLVLE